MYCNSIILLMDHITGRINIIGLNLYGLTKG